MSITAAVCIGVSERNWLSKGNGKMIQRSGMRQSFVTFVIAIFLGLVTNPVLASDDANAIQKQAWGELKLTGKHIKELVLFGRKGLRETFDEPNESVKLPAGQYRIQTLLVGRGEYICQCLDLYRQKEITVDANKLTELNIGAPLKQTVKVERQGSFLILNYDLRGVGGEEYRKFGAKGRENSEPQFAIYQGDNKIASGTFRYG